MQGCILRGSSPPRLVPLPPPPCLLPAPSPLTSPPPPLRLGACLRSLSALAAASRKEDRYGVLLLCDPNLGDVLVALASAVLVLQQYTRTSVSGKGGGEAVQ